MQNNILEHYYISNDIDCSGLPNFTPIGGSATPFRGNLDGGFFTIRKLRISSSSNYTGIFGSINNASIRNLILEDFNVELLASSRYFGVLAAQALSSNFYNIRIATSAEGSMNNITGNAVQYCGV